MPASLAGGYDGTPGHTVVRSRSLFAGRHPPAHNGGTSPGDGRTRLPEEAGPVDHAMASVVSFRPTSAARLRSARPIGARDRSFHVPGAAKNRNSPSGLVTTSAVNSSVAS